MKKVILYLIIGICQLGYSQTVKPLSAFYTDPYPADAESIVTPIYYKDINDYFTPFLGQWKNTNGNTTFIVTLWKETKHTFSENGFVKYYSDLIYGHYQIFINYGLSNQQLLHTSQINIGNTNQVWDTVILSDVTTPNNLNGTIYDVKGTPLNNNYAEGTVGCLSMIINTSQSLITANWKVSRKYDLVGSDQPINFTIPTNITLTKF